MTIKLVREDALVIRVTDMINSATVQYSKYASLSRHVTIKDGDELQTSSEDKLYRYVGNQGLSGFVTSEINERLVERYPFDSRKKDLPLREVAEFSNSVRVAKEIVSRLKQLPERYRLTVPLSAQFSIPLLGHVASIKMGDHAAVCRANKLPALALNSSNSLVDAGLFSDPFSEKMNTDRQLSEDHLYFTSVELGYVTANNSSAIHEQFLDKLRGFYGAMAAMGVMSEKFKSISDKKPFVLIHREGGSREILDTVEIPDDIWDRRWYQNTEEFTSSSSDKLLSIKAIFQRASLVLSDEEFSQRLLTACLWYYRATNSSNALDRILHAMISIEVLMGDRETAESVGLTKLLANRCAYFLGNNRMERQSITDQFVEIYRVRSAIVHGGKHKLDRRDRHAGAESLKLCASLISKELRLHQAQDLDSGL